MKKIVTIIFFIISFFIFFKPNNYTQGIVYAEENDIYTNIINQTEKDLENLDLGVLEEQFNKTNLSDEYTFKEFIKKLIKGEETLDFKFILNLIAGGIKESFKNSKTVISLLIVLSCISAIFNVFSEEKGNLQLYKYLNIAFLVVVVSVISYELVKYIEGIKEVISQVDGVVTATFPILIALMVTLGATNSSIIFKPTIAVFVNIILKTIVSIVLSLIVLYSVLVILNEISDNIKLSKFKNLVFKAIKYVIMLTFGLFVGYLSLNGIIASSGDKLSIKTAKYAMKNYIPLVGGYLSDSIEIFKLGCVLLKNSIGVSIIIILLYYLLTFVMPIIVICLGLNVIASLCEMFGNKKMSSFLSGSANTFKMLIGIVVAVFVVLFILLLFVIMVANSI